MMLATNMRNTSFVFFSKVRTITRTAGVNYNIWHIFREAMYTAGDGCGRIQTKREGKDHMAALLDLTKRRDAYIDQRLREDMIGWLSTVRPDGRPHSVAVWFLWDGETILIFSRPKKQKLYNIRKNANALLAIDNTHQGADPIVIEGTAALLESGTVDTTLPAYIAKYSAGMRRLGYTPEQMAAVYSEAIRIVPTRVL